jgi:hypothetical protein
MGRVLTSLSSYWTTPLTQWCKDTNTTNLNQGKGRQPNLFRKNSISVHSVGFRDMLVEIFSGRISGIALSTTWARQQRWQLNQNGMLCMHAQYAS